LKKVDKEIKQTKKPEPVKLVRAFLPCICWRYWQSDAKYPMAITSLDVNLATLNITEIGVYTYLHLGKVAPLAPHRRDAHGSDVGLIAKGWE